MPTFSNEIIVGGVPYELGEQIRVINFRDNLDYSFFDPVGGQCAPGAGDPSAPAPTGPSIPGMTVQPTRSVGAAPGRNRYSSRRGLRDGAVASMSPPQVLETLGRTLKHIIIHHDATYTSHHCFGVLCRRGLSTHFMVNHDGGLIQGLDPIYSAYHAGEFNGASIGIDMNNVATVEGHQQTYSDPAFGGTVDYAARELIEGRVNHSRKTSFAYTEAQYVTLCALLRLIHELTGFPLIFPQSDTGGVVRTRLTDPHNFIGFYGHWHCQAGKWDPGPGFDWERVLEGLHGKSNHWPLDLGTATLRDLRSQDSVDEATDTFFRAIEEGPGGGAYPLSLNQEWHDGVHIRAPYASPVYACAEGEILLTRNGPDLPLGSPNYVLMRHKIEREIIQYDAQGNAEVISDTINWYSLYMHMQRMYPSEVPDDSAEPIPAEAGGGREVPDDEEERPREIPQWYRILVQRARESKGGRLVNTENYELREVDPNPRQFETRMLGLLRTQEFRHAYQCVEDGNPFRWVSNGLDPEQTGLEVSAGTLLGYVGEFGERATSDALRVDKQPLLHFQIFSTVPIFDDTRFEASVWRRVQGDLSRNSLVSVPEIVLPILGEGIEEAEGEGPLSDLNRGRIVTPSEVQRFFEGGRLAQRHKMRTLITRHYSEWDIATDDSFTANIRVLWPWQNDDEFLKWRALHIGYKWLMDDTRDLLQMEEAPFAIYTYHPIYLLGWWALNYGRSLQGQTFEGLGGQELEAALEAEGELEFRGDDPDATRVSLEEMNPELIRYDDMDDLENGEWDPGTDFLNPLDRR